jgi:outer membrane protein OmpA-like peptidoglycan-associated protein
MRFFLIAFLFLLWLILGWLFYRDKQECCAKEMDVSAVPVQQQKTGPILFSYNNSRPILGDGWPKLRDSLATIASDSTALEIAGWYCTNTMPPETAELGLARANEVRKLFPNIQDDKLVIQALAINCDSSRIKTIDESVAFSLRKRTANIKETADGTMIYFPFNSTKKLNNAEVEAYLNDVADRVNKSGESISLIGHTDNIGSDHSNEILGMQRATIVRDYLLIKKVAPEKIKIESDGESRPFADNNTEIGRAQNRRTELKIIK